MPTNDTTTSGQPAHTTNGHRRRTRRPSHDRDPAVPRVAFYTVASHDTDPHPQATVMAQYAERDAALGHGEIRAVFFDIQGTPTRQLRGVTAITRDGGLADLLREAMSAKRRFDYLITPGLAWLDRHGIPILDVLRHLNRADVAYVVAARHLADELGYLIACDLLDGDL